MRFSMRYPILTIACGLLAACGGGEGNTGPEYSDSASTAEVADFAGDMAGQTALALGQLNFGIGSDQYYDPPFVQRYAPAGRVGRSSPIAFIDGECVQVIRGTGNGYVPLDEDENGVPDDFYFRMECTAVDAHSVPDTVLSVVQFTEGQIRQNAAALHGYTASYTTRSRLTDNFGNVEASHSSISQVLDIRSNAASYAYRYSQGGSETTGGVTKTFELGVADTTAFTPTGTIVLGVPLPSGSLTMSGREYALSSEGRNLSFAIATTTPLAFSAPCHASDSNPPFTAGAMRGRLNNNADQAHFTATFTACGVGPTIAVEGGFDESAVATRN